MMHLGGYHDACDILQRTHDTLRCTHGISPDVLMVSPNVLNIPRYSEHTLYRVLILI